MVDGLRRLNAFEFLGAKNIPAIILSLTDVEADIVFLSENENKKQISIFEKALYQGSCKAAIKAGREYAPEHIKWIVDKLMLLPDITFCPHGRPVAMEMSHKLLDRQFERC